MEQTKPRMNYYENFSQNDATSLMFLKNTSSKSLISLTKDLENILVIKHRKKSTLQLCCNWLTIQDIKMDYIMRHALTYYIIHMAKIIPEANFVAPYNTI